MNIMKILFFLIISTTLAIAKVSVSPDSIQKNKTGIDFYGKTSTYFSTSKLIAISKQIYFINEVEITEVVLDFENAPSQVKIYHMQLPSVKELQTSKIDVLSTNISSPTFNKESAEKAVNIANKTLQNVVDVNKEQNLSMRVNKVYPISTHSKIIEFTIIEKKDIDYLYKKIKNAFCDKASEIKLNGTLFKISK